MQRTQRRIISTASMDKKKNTIVNTYIAYQIISITSTCFVNAGKLMVSHRRLLKSPLFVKKMKVSDCCSNVALRLILNRQ